MNTAIVFFSKDGNTRFAANYLAGKLSCSATELKESKRGSVLGAIRNRASKLSGEPWEAIADASRVILMFPIWASHGVPAINAFIAGADLSGKDVEIITFQVDPSKSGSDKVHEYVADAVAVHGGSITGCTAMLGGGIGKPPAEAAICAQIDEYIG